MKTIFNIILNYNKSEENNHYRVDDTGDLFQ